LDVLLFSYGCPFIYLVLVLLAIASGVAKVMLMPQDVNLFGQYGFTNHILIAFGISQLIGGVLLAIPKTRLLGAIIVGVTFLISAAILVISGNIPMAIVTLIFVALLAFVLKTPLRTNANT